MNTRKNPPAGNQGAEDQRASGSATTVARGSAIAHPHRPYGLTSRELRAEIRRCAAHGWQLWEIRHRFPSTAPEPTR